MEYEDDAYVAEVLELPGCMAHADSYRVAAAKANEAISYGLILPKNSVIKYLNQNANASCLRTIGRTLQVGVSLK